MQNNAKCQALNLALTYVIVAGGWILFSDQLLNLLVLNQDKLVQVAIFKGWGFLLLTGAGLHHIVRRLLSNWEQEVEQRRKSEQDFLSLAELLPQLVWKCRPDGRNVYFNRRWVDYTGQTLEESYGDGWVKPFHPDERKRAADAWTNAVEDGAEYNEPLLHGAKRLSGPTSRRKASPIPARLGRKAVGREPFFQLTAHANG